MSATQTVGATVDGTGRLYFNNYVRANSSKKAANSELLANRVPLETLSWQDVFKARDSGEACSRWNSLRQQCTDTVPFKCAAVLCPCWYQSWALLENNVAGD